MINILYIKPLTIYLILFFVTGCAFNYNPPESGPIAYITYTKEHNVDSVEVINYKTTDCSGMSRIAFLYKPPPEDKSVNVPIPANESFISHFVYSTTINQCQITTIFIPEENTHYKAVFKKDFKSCYVNIYKLVKLNNETHLLPELSAKNNHIKCHRW